MIKEYWGIPTPKKELDKYKRESKGMKKVKKKGTRQFRKMYKLYKEQTQFIREL